MDDSNAADRSEAGKWLIWMQEQRLVEFQNAAGELLRAPYADDVANREHTAQSLMQLVRKLYIDVDKSYQEGVARD